jgi:hypothetical protein
MTVRRPIILGLVAAALLAVAATRPTEARAHSAGLSSLSAAEADLLNLAALRLCAPGYACIEQEEYYCVCGSTCINYNECNRVCDPRNPFECWCELPGAPGGGEP